MDSFISLMVDQSEGKLRSAEEQGKTKGDTIDAICFVIRGLLLTRTAARRVSSR